jgi:hypothetical protein
MKMKNERESKETQYHSGNEGMKKLVEVNNVQRNLLWLGVDNGPGRSGSDQKTPPGPIHG